jgi:hypothetical protein
MQSKTSLDERSIAWRATTGMSRASTAQGIGVSSKHSCVAGPEMIHDGLI